MRVEGSDGLAGAWLFAHLGCLLSGSLTERVEFEPALLINYAAPRRGGGAAELQDRADLRRSGGANPSTRPLFEGLGSLDRPLVMGGGCAVSRRPGRS